MTECVTAAVPHCHEIIVQDVLHCHEIIVQDVLHCHEIIVQVVLQKNKKLRCFFVGLFNSSSNKAIKYQTFNQSTSKWNLVTYAVRTSTRAITKRYRVNGVSLPRVVLAVKPTYWTKRRQCV